MNRFFILSVRTATPTIAQTLSSQDNLLVYICFVVGSSHSIKKGPHHLSSSLTIVV